MMDNGATRVKPYSIRNVTNRDDRFYDLLGPWLARREIVAELGDQMWDDDDKQWFVAIADDAVIGCVALREAATRPHVCSLYVERLSRKNVVGTTLLLRAIRSAPADLPVTATVAPAAVTLFDDCGFVADGTKGKFTMMTRTPR